MITIKAYQTSSSCQTIKLTNSPESADAMICIAEFVFGKTYRAVFAHGLVERLAALQENWNVEEEMEFGQRLWHDMIDRSLSKSSAYDVHTLHSKGYPLAAEAVSLLNDFFIHHITDEDLRQWSTILQMVNEPTTNQSN